MYCESNLVVKAPNNERTHLVDVRAFYNFLAIFGKLHIVLSTCQQRNAVDTPKQRPTGSDDDLPTYLVWAGWNYRQR